MAGLVHIVDASTPAENLLQLSRVTCGEDRVLWVGPVPDDRPIPPGWEVVRAPLGMPMLAGIGIRRSVSDSAPLHAWSLGAWRAAGAAARDWPVPLTLPRVPRAHEHSAVVKACGAGRMLVTVPTASGRQRLIAAGAPESHVALLPPACPAVASGDARLQTREALGLAAEDFVMVAPGPITPDSGQLFAVWVHAMIRRFMPNARLVVSGSGPSRQRVVNFSMASGFGGEHCLPDGRYRTMDILACADVALFLPERDCGLSVPAAAMAAGTPLVASDTPDIRELTQQGSAARLVKPGGARYAATAVCDSMREEDRTRELVNRGLEIAAARLTPAAVRKRLLGIHENLR